MNVIINIENADGKFVHSGDLSEKALAASAHLPWKKIDSNYVLNVNDVNVYKYYLIFGQRNKKPYFFIRKEKVNQFTLSESYRINAIRDIINDLLKIDYKKNLLEAHLEELQASFLSHKNMPIMDVNGVSFVEQINVLFHKKNNEFFILKKDFEEEYATLSLGDIYHIYKNPEKCKTFFTADFLNVDEYLAINHFEIYDELKINLQQEHTTFFKWLERLNIDIESPILYEWLYIADKHHVELNSIISAVLKKKMFNVSNFSDYYFKDDVTYTYTEKFLESKNFEIDEILFVNSVCSALFFTVNNVPFSDEKIKSYIDPIQYVHRAIEINLINNEHRDKLVNFFLNGTYRIYKNYNKDFDDNMQKLAESMFNFKEPLQFIKNQKILKTFGEEYAVHYKPILLTGHPGSGKTRFSKEIAHALGIPFSTINISYITAGFVLSGLDFSWKGGKQGKIFDVLYSQPYFNPCVLLDEIDKSSNLRHSNQSDTLGSLYPLLERDTSKHFIDEAIGIEMDASGILWIATANDSEQLPEPILSRLNIFNIKEITGNDKKKLIVNIYHELLNNHAWGNKFEMHLEDEVIEKLALLSNREISLKLEEACATHIANAISNNTIHEELILNVDDLNVSLPTKNSIGFLA